MKTGTKILAGLLTTASLLSMVVSPALAAATSRSYVVAANGQFWKDVSSGGAPIRKVRNGNASRGRYGVNVGKYNGKVIVLKTRMHNSAHKTVGSCDVRSGTYNWAKNSGKAGQTYHLNAKRQYIHDTSATVRGWWQADEN